MEGASLRKRPRKELGHGVAGRSVVQRHEGELIQEEVEVQWAYY